MKCTSCLCRGSKRAAILMRAARSRSLLREFVLGDNCLEPRDIFQQPLAGQDQEVIAELRILEVDLQQLLIADGQHMPVLGAFDRRRTAVIGVRKPNSPISRPGGSSTPISVTRNFPVTAKSISSALSPFLNRTSPLRYLRSVMNGLSHSIDVSPCVALRAFLTRLSI